jgi:hypothetical protein
MLYCGSTCRLSLSALAAFRVVLAIKSSKATAPPISPMHRSGALPAIRPTFAILLDVSARSVRHGSCLIPCVLSVASREQSLTIASLTAETAIGSGIHRTGKRYANAAMTARPERRSGGGIRVNSRTRQKQRAVHHPGGGHHDPSCGGAQLTTSERAVLDKLERWRARGGASSVLLVVHTGKGAFQNLISSPGNPLVVEFSHATIQGGDSGRIIELS